MINVGLIGAGNLGRTHALGMVRLPEIKIRCVADILRDRAEELANSVEAQAVADPMDLINRDDIDAVVIATPTAHHFDQAKATIEQGKHVFVEMPITRHLDEAEELLRLINGKDKVYTVGHSQRYYPEHQRIRQQVEQGAVGKPGMIRLGRRTPHPRNWYSDFDTSGGVIWDAMTHEFDYLQWVFGPVKRVFCKGLHGRRETSQLDYALASIRLQSGAIAHIESSWCHYGQFLLDVEVAGDNGLIQYQNQDAIPLHLSVIDLESGSRRYMSESPVIEPSHYKVLKAFFDAISGQASNPVPFAEAVNNIRVADACYQSITNQKPVELNQ